jgi:hypothetical protein
VNVTLVFAGSSAFPGSQTAGVIQGAWAMANGTFQYSISILLLCLLLNAQATTIATTGSSESW